MLLASQHPRRGGRCLTPNGGVLRRRKLAERLAWDLAHPDPAVPGR
ncbi:hypothetical protein [Micromonospora craniellae]|nr:hypothetical protein [Micromonospora craniellae]QOC90315.1 hypothetical protein ID554_19255 [Micromonospora craniellae]